MKTIDRIFIYLEKEGLKPATVEKEIGLGNGTLSKAQERSGNIRADVIEKFVDHFKEINISWLITGQGEMLKTQTQTQNQNQNEPEMNCNECPYKEMYQKLLKDSEWYQGKIDTLENELHTLRHAAQPERKRRAG